MEIKGITNEIKTEYPNINEISKKTLKKSIPNKWAKIGLTSWMLGIILKGQVLAKTLEISDMPLAGVAPVVTPGVVEYQSPIVKIINTAFPIVGGVSLIAFLISLIKIIKAKIKMKKENKKEKMEKRDKVVLIISIVLLLVSIISKILVGCCL